MGCTSPPTSRFPSAREMSRGRSPSDISRAEGNLEVGGDVHCATQFEAVYGHSLIINPSLGMYQEIHPCRASNTYSVKINTSLLMMRECIRTLPRGGMYWVVHPRRPRDFPRPKRCPEGHLEGRGKSRGRRGCTTHSLIIGREVLILTLYVLLALQGCIS